ncbi:MAG: hypothetical protein ACRYFX_04235, partial [Janthinobacterium lividum]
MRTTLLGNRLSRWLAMMLVALLSSSAAWAQSTANYAFTNSSTGSLVDMSSGTTDALATGTYNDDVASAVQPIGFTFGFMGTAYTQFSINSNGQLRLGATAISGGAASPTAGSAILAPMGGDNAIQIAGKVHYRVIAGTNRTLVVEWNSLRIPYSSTVGTGSVVQAVLEENTGKIEYHYGTVFNNSTSTAARSVFISAGTSAGQIGVVTNLVTTPAYDATATSATTSTFPANASVPVLNSTADGSRTVFTFTPPSGTPATPGLTISAVGQASLTLNITDNSTNEGYYTIARSTDNITFTTLATVLSTTIVATGGTFTYAQTGLATGTTYYYRVTANNEAAGVSANATATATTLAAVPLCGTKTVGPSTGTDYPTLTAAFAAVSINGLCGPLVLELQANYVSTTETFPIAYTYAGTTATNTVTVRPAAGATGLSITGTTASAVFNIVGGKYLIVDGRPGGSGTTVSGAAATTDLTIASTNASGIPLQFTSDATFNTVQHCQIKGVGTVDFSYPDVNFTGTATAGNSDNVVQYNNIGDGATTPTTLVYCGSTLNARNTISNNNLFNFYNATAAAYGIELNQSGNGWVVTGNSVYQTATRATVAFTTYAIYVNSGNGHTVSNNFIGGSAASAGGTPWTASGTTGAYRFVGIYLAPATGTATSVQGNTVANFSWASTSGATTTSGVWSGIYMSGSGDANIGTTTGNTIGTVAGPVSVTISTTTGGYSFGISTASSGTVSIVGNTISNLTGVGSTTSIASNVAGILASAGTANTINRNKLYTLVAGSGVANMSNGIWLTGGTLNTVTNNLIGDLQAATSTSLVAVSGILVAGGTTDNVYYNTINLGGTSTGATFGTSGIYLNSTSATLDLRNNIVVNKSTAVGTGGYTAAFRRVSGTAGTVPANYATTSNNNAFYAGTPSATNLIYVEGTTTATNAQQTLAAYKVFMANRDQASVTEDVPFVSTTGTAANFLHISTTTTTQVESAGTPITGTTTDYDGDTRNTTTPDIGADEGTFLLQDLTPPSITYTALANTNSSANRTLVVTITDVSGVATGANAPRLFYRKGTTGAFVSALATTVGGSSYTFTIDYSLVGGVTSLDVIQYYVAAQDAATTSNSGTSPSGGTYTTAPTTFNSYTVFGSLSGIYYVGSSTSPNAARTFTTLTSAIGAYNGSTLGGAVTFALLDASYSTAETFPLTLNANSDASAVNTLTIKPNTGVTATISGSVATGAVLKLNGADYIIIDGSNAGTATRDLTITNTSATGTGNTVLWIAAATATDGATNNTVRNTNLTGNSNTGFPQFTVFVGGGGAGVTAPTTSTPAANSNNTISNNAITKGFYGMFVYGVSATVLDQNNTVSGNQFGSGTGNGFGVEGIRAVFQQGLTIQANEIQNVVNAVAASHFGLNLGTLKGSTITRNSIHDVQSNSATSGYVGYGISLASTAFNASTNASANTISNNIIYSISAPLASTGSNPNVLGIANNGGYGDRIVFNTILLNAPQTAGVGYSAAISNGDSQFTTASSALDVRNNIIAITANVTTAAKYFGFYTSAANVTGSTLDYNDYFLNGTGAATFFVGNLNGTTLTTYATLALWQAATSQEANSKSVDPNFTQTSTAPFNLTPAASALNNAGTPISGVTVDYTGAPRSATPDIGAIEFTPAAFDLKPADLTAPTATQSCFSTTEAVTVQIQNNGSAPINFANNTATITVVVTPPTGAAQTFTTTLTTGTLAAGATQSVTLPGTLNMSATGTYSFAVTATIVGDANTANDNITITRTNAAPVALPYAETFPTSTLPTGFTTTSFFLSTSANNGTTGSYGLRVNIYSGIPTATATTPLLGTTVSTNNILTFDARFTNFSSSGPATVLQTGDKLDVQVSVCGGAFTTVYTIDNTNQNGTGAANASFYTYSVPLAGLTAGQRLQVRFIATYGGTTGSDFYVDVDNLNVVSLVPTDVAANALVAPAQPNATTGACYGSAEAVTVQIRNAGSTVLDFATNPVTVSATITGPGTPGTLAPIVLSTGTLAVGATQNVTFAATANLATAGAYAFAITATTPADGNTANNTITSTITVAAPVAGTLSPATSSLCNSGTALLTLTGAANGSIQYQSSASATGPFTNVAGATSATFTTPVLNTTTYFRAQVTCGTNVVTSNVSTITVNTPVVASTNTPVTICAGTTATLTATASAGSSVRFFSTATGGTALATATAGTYTTPALTASTTYYVEAFTGGSETAGRTAPTVTTGFISTGYGLVFNTTGATTIQSAVIYPIGTGTITFALVNSAGTELASTAALSVAGTGATTPVTVPLNLAVPSAGTDYRLVIKAYTGLTDLLRENPLPTGSTYPFTSTGGTLSFTAGYLSGTTSATAYYYFYNVVLSNECTTATRTAIQVNVTQPATAGFSFPTTAICAGTATTLTPTLATGATAGTFSLPAATGLTINATTGVVTVGATATAGTYTVTNTVAASGGCGAVTSTASFVLSGPSTATFSYSGSPFCTTAANPTPTITGTAGGTFSSTTGLSINATTGVITLSSSTAGTYSVTYTVAGTCGSSSTQSVTLTAPQTAGFSFPTTATCAGSATTKTPTLATGATNGTYTLPAATGLTINATTGVVTVGTTATAGTYTVTNTVAASGGCAAVTSTASFIISPQTTATFSYAGSPFCTTAANPTPTITGTAGGTFSSTTGLTLNATTGVITLSSSTAGTYSVTYTVAGTCGSSSTQSVTLTAPQTAGFSYAASPYCVSGTTNPTVTLTTGATAGTFSSTTGLTLNATTGAITLSSSTPGTYTVTNTVAASGGCAAVTSTASVTLTAPQTAGFSFPTATVCAGSTATFTPTLSTGATAGTFTLPAATGLTLNPTTGAVTVGATATTGTYTVTNTVAASGGCAAVTSTATFTVNPTPATPTLATSGTAATGITLTSSATTGNQFYLNGVAIAGATGQSYLINSGTKNGTYTVVVTNASGCSSPASPAVNVTVTATAAAAVGTAL